MNQGLNFLGTVMWPKKHTVPPHSGLGTAEGVPSITAFPRWRAASAWNEKFGILRSQIDSCMSSSMSTLRALGRNYCYDSSYLFCSSVLQTSTDFSNIFEYMLCSWAFVAFLTSWSCQGDVWTSAWVSYTFPAHSLVSLFHLPLPLLPNFPPPLPWIDTRCFSRGQLKASRFLLRKASCSRMGYQALSIWTSMMLSRQGVLFQVLHIRVLPTAVMSTNLHLSWCSCFSKFERHGRHGRTKCEQAQFIKYNFQFQNMSSICTYAGNKSIKKTHQVQAQWPPFPPPAEPHPPPLPHPLPHPPPHPPPPPPQPPPPPHPPPPPPGPRPPPLPLPGHRSRRGGARGGIGRLGEPSVACHMSDMGCRWTSPQTKLFIYPSFKDNESFLNETNPNPVHFCGFASQRPHFD